MHPARAHHRPQRPARRARRRPPHGPPPRRARAAVRRRQCARCARHARRARVAVVHRATTLGRRARRLEHGCAGSREARSECGRGRGREWTLAGRRGARAAHLRHTLTAALLPKIPGITVPLSHLPLLLLALLFSQVIHEAGHALTAALDALPLLSAGVALTLVFPSAFVALPSAALRALPPPARLRVVSAGALHNLLLYLLLALLASAGAPGALWRAAGYTDTRAWGRVIARVAQDSPLRAHLPPGAVVTRLDDTSLATGGGTADVWTSYLSSAPESSLQDHALGWCVDRAWFIDQPTSCCASLGSSPAPLFCFTSPPAALSEPFDLERCIDPLPLLSASSPVAGASVQRCHAPVDCGSARLCTRPRADQELLRLALHLPAWLRDEGEQAEEKVVLWGGPREEVLEEVEVSTWLPRHRFLPVRLPVLVGAFFAYLQMLNLSLYLFNLIPLPFLDGAQLLDAALDLALSWRASRSTDVELDSLEGGHAPAPHAHTPGARFVLWKHRVLRAAHAFAGMLIGLCVLLGALTAIR
ncbi:hypothetical protein AcW1_010198 [Taiwanofungus camphoratus]|nr:hypothetical protein AcW1_010198 [Antrodia cinnamomea]